MSQGNIVQCIGAVVDIQFPRDAMPRIYNALQLDKAEESDMCETDLMFEVQQQLGDGVVRTIAMGSSDGLRRGMKVNDTGGGIAVPVGNATIGRIMNVLGRPIDEAGRLPPKNVVKSTSSHRSLTSCRHPSTCWKPGSR